MRHAKGLISFYHPKHNFCAALTPLSECVGTIVQEEENNIPINDLSTPPIFQFSIMDL